MSKRYEKYKKGQTKRVITAALPFGSNFSLE